MRDADQIEYTFNWFYTDDKHIAYFNSGLNPVRAAHTNPLFPSWARYAWSGLHPSANVTPSSITERQTPQRAHPQAIDQSFLTSWNNKQAPGYNDAATAQEFSSIYRSQLLDNNINHYMAIRHGKLTLVDLINAMGNAGTQDLRGVEVLPYALRVLGHPSDPALATALSRAARVGGERLAPDQPRPSGSQRPVSAVGRGADHGCLVAAARPGRVRARARAVAALAGGGRLPDQRRARARHQRRAPRVRLRRRLLRDRPEGPARRARPARTRRAQPRLLRPRLAGTLPGRASRARCVRRSRRRRPRSTRPTASARPATRCAQTRSNSAPSGRSPSP